MNIQDERYRVAEKAFEDADFDGLSVEATGGWETDGLHRLQRPFFLDTGDLCSSAVLFAVEFRPDTAELASDPEFTLPPRKDHEEMHPC